ncbi:MAG: hypothetical protein DVB23_000808 [Verrucomicrobia bacterium]|nr:MAG: hypothetical protein DVB23_000808 [Verrucomicrobiota bacterium]
MIPSFHSLPFTTTLVTLFVLGHALRPGEALADSCHHNLIRMSRELQNLTDDLNDELDDQLDGSSVLYQALRDAERIEDLAHEIEEMAEDGETDCHCFERTLANLHREVHHLESLLYSSHGKRSRRCFDEAFNLLNRIDSAILRMERVLDSWEFSSRFDQPHPDAFAGNNPWTGPDLGRGVILMPTGQAPVFRAIPIR